jgi:phosphoribosylanthranilate isomerase
MVRVKICGITNPQDALLACDLGADAIGLNFYPQSSRCISPADATRVIEVLPPFIATVGIFVNWTPEAVIALSQALHLSAAQLHGDESPSDAAAVAKKLQVIKAIRAEQGSKLTDFDRYKSVSTFLLDSAPKNQFGGTGTIADWNFAQSAAKSHRIILAGGLTPENVTEAIRTVRPYAVDVTTGVESSPGKKDPSKLRAFFAEVARANSALSE